MAGKLQWSCFTRNNCLLTQHHRTFHFVGLKKLKIVIMHDLLYFEDVLLKISAAT